MINIYNIKIIIKLVTANSIHVIIIIFIVILSMIFKMVYYNFYY